MSNQLLTEIRRLADEIELKIHLGRMDARDRWAALRPQLENLEHAVEEKGWRAVDRLATALRVLREEIRDELDTDRPR
jgi:hypothetical protein